MASENWKRTGDNTLVQTIHDPGSAYTLTREFNFSDRDVTTAVVRGDQPVTNTYEDFRQFDQSLLREAGQEMQRLGGIFRLETAARLRRENTEAVVAIFSQPKPHDIAAPQKASFARKARGVS